MCFLQDQNSGNSRIHDIEEIIEIFSEIHDDAHHLKNTARGPRLRRIDELIEQLSEMGKELGKFLRHYNENPSPAIPSDESTIPNTNEDNVVSGIERLMDKVDDKYAKILKNDRNQRSSLHSNQRTFSTPSH